MTRISGSRPGLTRGLGGPQPSAKDAAQVKESQAKTAVSAPRDVVETAQAREVEQQKIEAFAKAQVDRDGAGAGLELAQMSVSERYDYLHQLTVQHAAGDDSAWKDADREANLIGLRGWALGSPQGFGDSLFVLRLVDAKKTVETFRLSAQGPVAGDAQRRGLGYFDDADRFVAMPLLATGFYRNAFMRTAQGLRQKGLLRMLPEPLPVEEEDSGGDRAQPPAGQLDARSTLLVGPRWRVRFYAGAETHRVLPRPPGCQLVHPQDWANFQRLLADCPAVQDQGSSGFSYLLLDAQDLPPAAGPFVALQRNQVDARTVFQQPPDLATEAFDPHASAATMSAEDAALDLDQALAPEDLDPAAEEAADAAQNPRLGGLLAYFVEPVDGSGDVQ